MNATTLLNQWERMQKLPAGRTLFSMAIGRAVPYTGTISPRVLELRPGYAKVQLKERRRVRNHLDSVHAIAQTNLGEFTSGLAMLAGIPDDARGIVLGLETDYLKKARGILTAECTCEPPRDASERDLVVTAVVRDEVGDEVSRTRVRWRIGPRDKR